MGLFDFAKSVGKKVFGKEAEASEKIKQEIEQDNPGLSGLDVSYDNGVVSLKGKADSPEAMEKAVLMAGNIQGVAEVKVDALEVPASADAASAPKVEFYLIESGDTLSAIAKRFYGDANAYGRIFEANREVIKNPDLIYPGQKIRIPHDAS
ncbi:MULTISPECIES: peptidoglycan-binding protein LysM [Thiorhodovibrio]|uniref:peptidoglycan-binding protein LysM n=1 Tax=Thiorhodovibrio TaxID=61593 RepID=UPI0019116DCC|nr:MULTISPECIES: peptidoglycan-binding protein LysM [Thiorhodovibrio]MBK5969634.1 peptidoglycan-binding protein LysM [Thiorhodovibrio winogradskyi]WPL14702.1 LysM domain/BON superfamily protein [Thiorhodovibrio litoralis]